MYTFECLWHIYVHARVLKVEGRKKRNPVRIEKKNKIRKQLHANNKITNEFFFYFLDARDAGKSDGIKVRAMGKNRNENCVWSN